MIYFDNAATGGRKPDQVLTAVSSSIRVCANPGRGGHKLALSCANTVQNCRNALCEFFNAYSFDRVVFTKNCTEALNIAILGTLKQGDHVIVSCMEHNSVLRPLEYLKKSGVITYDVCPLEDDGRWANVTPQAVRTLLRPNTKLVAITAASNVNGTIPPIGEIRKMLPENVLFLCDAAQGAGHLSLKMQGAGIDLMTVAGHKGMLGIQGSGALLFSERVDLSPILYGGTGSMSISLDMPDFYPDGLEAGTLSYPAVCSLLEGTRYVGIRLPQIQAQLLSLTNYLLDGLQELRDYTVYSQPNVCGIVSFKHDFLQSEYLAGVLSTKYDIATRGGLHCAPLMHEALGTLDNGLVRVSFSHYNNEREIDVLLQALREIQQA
ncbi:MAG: aminotransferase class V-fold PLP-dependent enzyme [Clostridia bacterium]|nr:aminotransferase class V-fold PLP-dependent enzyme [Clostridia bacterium]